MSVAKFQVGDKVRISFRCPKDLKFKGVDKIFHVSYDSTLERSWYLLKKKDEEYLSYELEKV